MAAKRVKSRVSSSSRTAAATLKGKKITATKPPSIKQARKGVQPKASAASRIKPPSSADAPIAKHSATSAALEYLFGSASVRVSPTLEEAEREKKFAIKLSIALGSALSSESAKIYFVGSTARDTGLRGDRDIDLFCAFPTSMEREQIVTKTFEAVKSTIPGQWRTNYAEHPYLQATLGDYKVEVIPCFAISPNERTKSAVDRSPLHMDYLQKRLTEKQKRDVRVLKQLLKSAGIYGAEAKIGGFSGLICEYLVLNYRSLEGLLTEASKWKPPVVIDIEGAYGGDSKKAGESFPESPLVLIDAIDRNRNAAAAISMDSFAAFVSLSQSLLADPDERFFEPAKFQPLALEQVKPALNRRGTAFVMVQFPVSSAIVEDILYPQLRRTLSSLCKNLQSKGFPVIDSSEFHFDGYAYFVIEFPFLSKPDVEAVEGPPAWLHDQVRAFLKQHPAIVRGPFIRSGKVVVETAPAVKSAFSATEALLNKDGAVAVGPDLLASFRRARVYDLGKSLNAIDDGGLLALSQYLAKGAAWLKD